MLNGSFAHSSRQILKLDVHTMRRITKEQLELMLRAIYLRSKSTNPEGPAAL
jgi:hypothetical protein